MRVIRIVVVLGVSLVVTAATSKVTKKDIAKFNNIRDVLRIEQELRNRAFNEDVENKTKGWRREVDRGNLKEFTTDALAMIVRQTTVYGRPDIFQATRAPSTAMQRIDSTAAIFYKNQLEEDTAAGTFRLKDQRTLEQRGVCKDSLVFQNDVSFTNEPGEAICTGFLLEPDVLVTAAHCAPDANIRRLRFVFGYKEVGGKVNTVFPASNVLTGEIIDRRDSDVSAEWARIKLARAPGPDKMPISAVEVKKNNPVSVIGCPAGTGVKFASGATVRDDSGKSIFVANLDVFEGNSGSPVFNTSMEVVGILARGERDWVPGSNCRQPKKCPDDQCLGETVTRITALPPL